MINTIAITIVTLHSCLKWQSENIRCLTSVSPRDSS